MATQSLENSRLKCQDQVSEAYLPTYVSVQLLTAVSLGFLLELELI